MKASLKDIGKSSSFGQGSLSGWYGGRSMEAAIKGMGSTAITRDSLTAYLRTASLSVRGIPVSLALPKDPGTQGGYDGLANPSAYVNQWNGNDLQQKKLVKNVFASGS